MSVADLVEAAELVVVVGPGGVGKTTTAAALGLGMARRGHRVLVLTIDPARRLADAMGLDGLDDRARPVMSFGRGRLEAAMLDTQASYDALMRRIHGDADGAKRIIENRVYRSFRRTLARSHAYVAMERLYEALEGGHYDRVVVDTPPMRNALDILDAPGSLSRFLDDTVLGWFLKPPQGGKLSRLLPQGGAAARRLLALLASRRLVDEMATFFSLLVPQREGFAERARVVRERLVADSTRFCLVTSPAPTALDDASYMARGLGERNVRLNAVIFNRAFLAWPGVPCRPILDATWQPEALRQLDMGWVPEKMASFIDEIEELVRRTVADNRAALARMQDFVAELRAGVAWTAVAELPGAIHDLEGLGDLAGALLGEGPDLSV